MHNLEIYLPAVLAIAFHWIIGDQIPTIPRAECRNFLGRNGRIEWLGIEDEGIHPVNGHTGANLHELFEDF